jgi:hypothetical protein
MTNFNNKIENYGNVVGQFAQQRFRTYADAAVRVGYMTGGLGALRHSLYQGHAPWEGVGTWESSSQEEEALEEILQHFGY